MTSRDTLIAILILAIVGIAIFFILQGRTPLTNDQTGGVGGALCAQDVRQCSDGSYVSRVPPTCDFAACPGGAAGASGNVNIIIPGTNGSATGTGR